MNLVRSRKVGNSVTVTLPKELEISAGEEFLIQKGRGGVIILTPRVKNPFDGKTDLKMEDDFSEVTLNEHEF